MATTDDYRNAAQAIHASDDIEIDDDAVVSMPEGREGGAWVAAWVWADDENLNGV